MRTWKRETYKIVEAEHDYDLHVFKIVKDGEVINTICPGSIEEMEDIVKELDAGECVDGWEDGMGNTIRIDSIINELGE